MKKKDPTKPFTSTDPSVMKETKPVEPVEKPKKKED
jgi:hypothetical protein